MPKHQVRSCGMGFVLSFGEIDRTQVARVGGKGANLGELARIEGVAVPDGFCVTTDAFARTVADAPGVEALLDELARTAPEDQATIRALSAEIRGAIERLPIPEEV